MNSIETCDVLIVGGGIAGLAAAERICGRDPRRKILLLEREKDIGGVVRTIRQDGFLVETGPDSFLTAQPQALESCRALGLEGDLLPTDPVHRRSFILRGERLLPVPEGIYLLAPSSLRALVGTPLFTLRGKFRMAIELLIPARRTGEDESLASFVRRRLGREALERLAQPMVAGIYSADPETLSLEATFPQFLEYERTYGSVLRGLARRRGAQTGVSGPRYGLFVTLREGLSSWVKALAARIPPGAVRGQTPVRALRREGGLWIAQTPSGQTFSARRILLAVGASAAGRLLAQAAPDLSALLLSIPHGSTVAVSLGLRREDVGHPLDGMGFVAPTVEKKTFSACSFVSTKFPNRAPAGSVLLRLFAGGPQGAALLPRADGEIADLLTQEIAPILKLSGKAVMVHVARHPQAMPHYKVGHLAKIRAIREAAGRLGGLFLAGNAYTGVGLPACVASAWAAADQALAEPNPKNAVP